MFGTVERGRNNFDSQSTKYTDQRAGKPPPAQPSPMLSSEEPPILGVFAHLEHQER
jgi:hypothetical protein